MRFRASSKTVPGRVNRSFARSPAPMAEPFKTAEVRKTRWLVATSLTGLLGIASLATVLLLAPEPRNHNLTTKPLPHAGLPQRGVARLSSDQRKTSAPPAGKAAKLASGPGKQAMLKPSQSRDEAKATAAHPETDTGISLRSTDFAGDSSITGIEKLTSKNTAPKDLPAPATLRPQSHGDLMAALKAGPRPSASTTHAKNNLGSDTIADYLRAPAKTAGGTEDVRLIVGRGDTLYGLLTDKGISPVDATNIISELRPVFSPKSLKKGHIVAMTLRRNPALGTIRPELLEVHTKSAARYAVRLNRNGDYQRIGKPVVISDISKSPGPGSRKKSSRYNRARARIQSSFYQSALAQNLPPGIVNKMTSILSYDVDFQREVNRGDQFEVLYSDQKVKDKGVLYAELVTNRKKHAFYRFKSPDGMINYYNKNGESAQKTFMRTPVSGARITSRFGRRRHPIQGYTKMHTGVDFGVARGTPIYAAASGKVQKAGWAGGYGKYVRIRHSKKLATAYAHMSRIARGVRPGKKISQGQIIGYVGSTGRSTGPHLHYEIRVSGKPVNPMRYKLANKTKKLSRKWLALFKKEKSRIDRLRKTIPVSTNVASIDN